MTAPPGLHGVFNVGDYVNITGAGESAPLAGQTGQIKEVVDGKFAVQLTSGLKIGPLLESFLQSEQGNRWLHNPQMFPE